MPDGVGANQEVRKNTSRSGTALRPPAGRICLIGAACRSPDDFIHAPIHHDARLSEKIVEKLFVSRRESKQFGIHGSRNSQTSTPQRLIQRGPNRKIQVVFPVPEDHENIRINRSRHGRAFREYI